MLGASLNTTNKPTRVGNWLRNKLKREKRLKETDSVSGDVSLLEINANLSERSSLDNSCGCLFQNEDVSSYLFCVATKGNFKEFQKLVQADPSRLLIVDTKGLSALHHAAANGHCNIAEYVIAKGGDINLATNKGDTALHLAVENGHTKVIDLLVERGADTSIQNEAGMAPLHVAADLGIAESVKALVDHKSTDVNTAGQGGLTPLHYCAIKDRDACAKILIEHGARPCAKCQQGFYPIHLAATSAAARTLEVLIKYVESLGYTREDVLSFTDKDNNMPLHSAVNGGDKKAVRVCLEAGAPVNAQQEDKSTPLHFACAQGSLEMISLMYEIQPDRFMAAMGTTDVLNRTPLHRAALFNHVDVVQYLLEKGADIDAQDSQDRTALLIAAAKGCWKTVTLLIDRKAEISLRDQQNRNFLHLAIKLGGKFSEFGNSLKKDIQQLLNEKDDYGCTPLHYASKEGHLIAIDDLINMGASINPKNNDKQSPLHFAARYGRYNTCRRLLESPQGTNIINETDGEGKSALHIASLNGHTKIINLLMEKGAYVTKDNEENSPMHMAASNGYTKSIKLLLGVHANLLDCVNKHKETALHVAAKNGQVSTVELLLSLGADMRKKNVDTMSFFDCAIYLKNTDVALAIIRHERWHEAMSLCSPRFGCPMSGLIQNLPEVCLSVLDQCKWDSGQNTSKKDYYIEYDFQYLQCPIEYTHQARKDGKKVLPLFALNHMVLNGRVECLSHPVCKTYLEMKWRAYGVWFHSINLITYLIYLALLTYLVTTVDNGLLHDKSPVNNSTAEKTDFKMHMGQNFCVYIVMALASLNMIKEVLQMVQQKLKYFMDVDNAIEWILYVTTVIYVGPMLVKHTSMWQAEAGAIAVFLAWFNCLLFLQRFDVFGIYVVMFLEILRTLVQALCVFSLLIVAFGLAFFLLMQTEITRAYSTPGLAILRAGMMMLELDYMASFNDPYTDKEALTLGFGNLTIFFLVLFVLLMPILLMNLLIGLAVGDIEAVQKDATLKRLAMQVELHTDLEIRLPKWLLLKVDKVQYRIYPNKCNKTVKSLWKKMTWNNAFDVPAEEQNKHLFHVSNELFKQKQRLKELTVGMQKQYDLLRLIVQKMEIVTEDDNRDEGIQTVSSLEKINLACSSKPFRVRNAARTNAIVSHWKKETRESKKYEEKKKYDKNEHDC